jgi:hypothetical protein
MKRVVAFLFILTFCSIAGAALYDPYTGKPIPAGQVQQQAASLPQSQQASWTDIAQTYGPLIIIGSFVLAFLIYGFHLIRAAMNKELIFYYNFLDFSANIGATVLLGLILWKWPYRYVIYANGTKSYDPSYIVLIIGIVSLLILYNLGMGIFTNSRFCHPVTGFFVGVYRIAFYAALPIAMLFCLRTGDKKEFYGRPGEERDPTKYRSVIDTALTVIAMGALFYTASKLCNGREVREKHGC